MPVLAWREEYNVHIKTIDEQHKQLVEMINMLHDAMREGRGKAALDKILGNLINYTRSHFAAEERLMMEHDYPGFKEHKSKHDKMTAKVLALQSAARDGKSALSFEVADFLQDWLTKHILGTDKKYCGFFNGKGVS